MDAAGRQVGHAAVGKRQPRLGHVLVTAQQRQTQRRHLAHRRCHQRQQHVEVVDHKVEHDADVQRAAAEGAEATEITSLGCKGRRRSSSKTGLKRSMWPTWSNTPRWAARATSSSASSTVAASGLLDQQADAASEEVGGDRVVLDRGYCHHGRINVIEQGMMVGEGPGAAAAGDRLGLLGPARPRPRPIPPRGTWPGCERAPCRGGRRR